MTNLLKTPKIGQLVKAGQMAKFSRFVSNQFWYYVTYDDGGNGTNFEFPIPLSDTEGAYLQAEEKAILLMRWINAWLKVLEQSHATI